MESTFLWQTKITKHNSVFPGDGASWKNLKSQEKTDRISFAKFSVKNPNLKFLKYKTGTIVEENK